MEHDDTEGQPEMTQSLQRNREAQSVLQDAWRAQELANADAEQAARSLMIAEDHLDRLRRQLTSSAAQKRREDAATADAALGTHRAQALLSRDEQITQDIVAAEQAVASARRAEGEAQRHLADAVNCYHDLKARVYLPGPDAAEVG